MFEDVDLTGVETISFGYASVYGAIVEIHLDSPLGPQIGSATLEVTAAGFPGNRPETWVTANASITHVEGKRDVYYYFRKDKTFAQDLLRMDWDFYNEKAPRYKKMGSADLQKVIAIEKKEQIYTPNLNRKSI